MLIGNDTIGTTLVLIATNAFSTYQSDTGAVLDDTTGLLRITSTQYKNLKTLTFVVGGVCTLLKLFSSVWNFLYILFSLTDFIRFNCQRSNLAS